MFLIYSYINAAVSFRHREALINRPCSAMKLIHKSTSTFLRHTGITKYILIYIKTEFWASTYVNILTYIMFL